VVNATDPHCRILGFLDVSLLMHALMKRFILRTKRNVINHTLWLSLRRPRRRWEDNINMYLTEKLWDGMDCIDVVQDKCRVEGCCEHVNESSGS
jgi:hypothetical protein